MSRVGMASVVLKALEEGFTIKMYIHKEEGEEEEVRMEITRGNKIKGIAIEKVIWGRAVNSSIQGGIEMIKYSERREAEKDIVV